MTDDLTAFVRARLDEDEAAAREASEYASPAWHLGEHGEEVLCWEPEPRIAEAERLHGLPVVSDRWRGFYPASQEIAAHIARHDPARVLREVAAKRELVRYHAVTITEATPLRRQEMDRMEFLRVLDAERTLGWLAAAWSDHPDYRQEWAPT